KDPHGLAQLAEDSSHRQFTPPASDSFAAAGNPQALGTGREENLPLGALALRDAASRGDQASWEQSISDLRAPLVGRRSEPGAAVRLRPAHDPGQRAGGRGLGTVA